MIGAGSQTVPDHPFEAADVGFDQSPPAIARLAFRVRRGARLKYGNVAHFLPVASSIDATGAIERRLARAELVSLSMHACAMILVKSFYTA